jgi:hypothetical protein
VSFQNIERARKAKLGADSQGKPWRVEARAPAPCLEALPVGPQSPDQVDIDHPVHRPEYLAQIPPEEELRRTCDKTTGPPSLTEPLIRPWQCLSRWPVERSCSTHEVYGAPPAATEGRSVMLLSPKSGAVTAKGRLLITQLRGLVSWETLPVHISNDVAARQRISQTSAAEVYSNAVGDCNNDGFDHATGHFAGGFGPHQGRRFTIITSRDDVVGSVHDKAAFLLHLPIAPVCHRKRDPRTGIVSNRHHLIDPIRLTREHITISPDGGRNAFRCGTRTTSGQSRIKPLSPEGRFHPGSCPLDPELIRRMSLHPAPASYLRLRS